MHDKDFIDVIVLLFFNFFFGFVKGIVEIMTEILNILFTNISNSGRIYSKTYVREKEGERW